jgi:hypothetical protein
MLSACFTLSVGQQQTLALRYWKSRHSKRENTLFNFIPCIHFLTCQIFCVDTLRNKAELYVPWPITVAAQSKA